MPQVSKNLIKASDLLTNRFPKPKLELSMNWRPSKLKGQLNELIGEEHSAHLTITSSIIQSFQEFKTVNNFNMFKNSILQPFKHFNDNTASRVQ